MEPVAPYPGTTPQRSDNRLIRPTEGRWIAGVAAGLADRFGMPRMLMRILFLLSCVLPGPQVLIYLALWMVVPSEG